MKKLSIVVGLLFGLGACSSKIDKAISELEGWKDKMCACKDKECAEKVEKDFDVWNKEMRAKFKDDKDEGNEDQKKKAKELFKALHECERKGEGDTPPGAAVDTPPSAPAPAPAPATETK